MDRRRQKGARAHATAALRAGARAYEEENASGMKGKRNAQHVIHGVSYSQGLHATPRSSRHAVTTRKPLVMLPSGYLSGYVHMQAKAVVRCLPGSHPPVPVPASPGTKCPAKVFMLHICYAWNRMVFMSTSHQSMGRLGRMVATRHKKACAKGTGETVLLFSCGTEREIERRGMEGGREGNSPVHVPVLPVPVPAQTQVWEQVGVG